ncbi:MAG: hypothetical protein R2703_01785 [Micropruina glycogenica]|jgi:hypothetical protein
MTDKYHLEMIESATGVLTDDEQGLLVMLPIELRDAFVLLATHDRADDAARHLALALGRLNQARTGSSLHLLTPARRLQFLLTLTGYLHRLPEGWHRQALTTLGAAAVARTPVEARGRLRNTEAAVVRGVGELAQSVTTSAAA